MKVGELKKLLENVGDDVEVLTDASDHSYRMVAVEVTTALRRYERGAGILWTEDYGEKLTPAGVYGERVPAVVVT